MNVGAAKDKFQERTKGLILRVIKLFRTLPREPAAQIIGKQILRSATSVGANYRAACRGRSKAEFISKLGIVVEEMDETAIGWNSWEKPTS
jgi:four helix bundle protein